MKQCFSFIARTYPNRPGLDLCTPDSHYWMIDDGHLTELRRGKPHGSWTHVGPSFIAVRWDLPRWGFDVAKMPRLVMLNIERMDNWHDCKPGMIEIVNQIREIREDVTICLYGHAGIEHAVGIVDALTHGCNHVARTNAIIPPDIIPTLHPGEYTVGDTAIAMRRLHEQGHKTLLIWEVCSHQQYQATVDSHAALSKAWREMA